MSLFPFISVPDDFKENNIEELPLYREIAWDYKNNIPIIRNGEPIIVEGNEAIKVWCYKAILCPRYEYEIYSNGYGSELVELIGKAYTPSLTKSEAKRYIEEALSINQYIKNVNVTETNFINDKLTAKVQIETIYGYSEVSV